jgi:hypothetical protein
MPRVSVVMPVFNGQSTVAAAITSVLSQSFSDFELIVVDDGSTDDTQRVLETITDARLKILRLSHNQGIAAALNAGFEQASAELLARMDADDLCHPQRLELQMGQFLADPDLSVAGTFMQTMGRGSIQWTMPLSNEGIRARLLFGTGLFHPTVMLRRDLITDGELSYDPAWVPVEDYEFWTRLAANPRCRFATLPQPLVTYRARPRESDYGRRQRSMSALVSERLAIGLGLIANSEEIAQWRVLAGNPDTIPVAIDELVQFSLVLGSQGAPRFGVDTGAMQTQLRHCWYSMGMRAESGLEKSLSVIPRHINDHLVRAYLSGRIGALARRSRLLRWGYNRSQKRL